MAHPYPAVMMTRADLLLSLSASTPSAIYWKDQQLRYLGCNGRFLALASPQQRTGSLLLKTDAELHVTGSMKKSARKR